MPKNYYEVIIVHQFTIKCIKYFLIYLLVCCNKPLIHTHVHARRWTNTQGKRVFLKGF